MVWPGERKAKENNDSNERSNVSEGVDTLLCDDVYSPVMNFVSGLHKKDTTFATTSVPAAGVLGCKPST